MHHLSCHPVFGRTSGPLQFYWQLMITGYGAGTPIWGLYFICYQLIEEWLLDLAITWANYIHQLRKSYRQHYVTENARWNEHVRDCGSKCHGWATERGWQHDLKDHRTEPSSQDQLQRSVNNGEMSTRHDANHVGRYWHRIALSLHRPTHNQGSRSGWPVTGTHQSDKPAVAIDQRVRSQEPTILTHSGQQSPIGDVSKPQSSTWNFHHTDVKIQKFDKYKHDIKPNSTHKTDHQQGQPEWSRAPLKSVSDMPSAKAGSHSDRTELGWGLNGKK